MKPAIHSSLGAAALLALSTIAASGATLNTVSTVTIVETSSRETNTTTDSVTNAAGGTENVSIVGTDTTVATQNFDGTSEVIADTGSTPLPTLVTSTAQFQQGEVNDSGISLDYTLSYELTGQSATFDARPFILIPELPEEEQGGPPITALSAFSAPVVVPSVPSDPDSPFVDADPTALALTQFSGASFEYNISVDTGAGFQTLFNARADALLNPFGSFDLEYDAVDGFTPSSSLDSNGNLVFSVGAISGDIFLGSIANGQTINVVSTLIARAYTPGDLFGGPVICLDCPFEGNIFGVNTFSADPVKLSSIGALSSAPTQLSAVPLPAAGWMLIAGLGGLFALRRKS